MNLGTLKIENIRKAFFSLKKMLKQDENIYPEKLKLLEELKEKYDISLLGVIILNSKGKIKSDFFWNDSEINNITIKKFLYNNLLKLFEKSIKTGRYIALENNEKIYNLPQ